MREPRSIIAVGCFLKMHFVTKFTEVVKILIFLFSQLAVWATL